jgi:hypothetical protein
VQGIRGFGAALSLRAPRPLATAPPLSARPAPSSRILDTILSSTTRLVANKASWQVPEKRKKIEDLAQLLQVRGSWRPWMDESGRSLEGGLPLSDTILPCCAPLPTQREPLMGGRASASR